MHPVRLLPPSQVALTWPLLAAVLCLGCSTPEAQPQQPSATGAQTSTATGTPAATTPEATPAPSSEPAPTAAPSAGTAAGSTAGVAPSSEQLGDPASAYCAKQGHRVERVSSAAGERAVCVFGDGSRCEAWRYKRGECQAGSCRAAEGICQ